MADGSKKWMGGSPLAVLGRLVLVSILVGIVLAALGLDPFDIISSVERLIRSIWNMGFDVFRWLWRYFLLGAVIVIPIWIVVRLVHAPTRLKEQNATAAHRAQGLQVMKPETLVPENWETHSKIAIAKELYVSVVGWIWVAAVLASLYFLVRAIFFDDGWWPVVASAAVAWVLYKVSLYYLLEGKNSLPSAAKAEVGLSPLKNDSPERKGIQGNGNSRI
jgi:Family of unknown function (DUF6460)